MKRVFDIALDVGMIAVCLAMVVLVAKGLNPWWTMAIVVMYLPAATYSLVMRAKGRTP